MWSPMTIIVFIICWFVTILAAVHLCVSQENWWQVVSAVATMWAVWVAWKKLGDSSKTSHADFIRRFSDRFFEKPTRDLINLLDNKALSFQKEEPTSQEGECTSYFAIDMEKVDKLKLADKKKEELKRRKVYSTYEMDDWLLGHLEDVAFFERSGLLDIKEVYHHFDWYVDMVWASPEVQKYIASQRQEERDGKDIYEEFENIATKLGSYRKAKAKGGLAIVLWRLRWPLGPK
jgi:hypothetical protein